MEKKLLFNPNASDEERRIIKGDTTNLFNLNDVKYPWAKSLYRVMMANFWIPEKVDLTKDVNDYLKLSSKEQEAFSNILSFLIFLDSVQTNNVPNIAEYITAPEVNTLLAIQTYQEAVHSQSYAYIVETVIPAEERQSIYNKWRDNKLLLDRNKYIAQIYQEFLDNPSDEKFAKVLIANFILEGLYFYNGFNFFYNLASRNLMLGTADEIRYINRDEFSHLNVFRNIIKEIEKENPGYFDGEMIKTLLKDAVDQEILWTNEVIGDDILGISKESTINYTKHLANRLCDMLRVARLFDGVENPYKHLNTFADESNDSVKSNFFESNVTNYSQSSAVDGWDDL